VSAPRKPVRVKVRAKRWSDPGAKRFVLLFEKALDEGRSFSLSMSPDGAIEVELGPRLPSVVHVRARGPRRARKGRKAHRFPKGGAS
jgi:hypothetical protein